jgi:prolyl 4-hydroxylase
METFATDWEEWIDLNLRLGNCKQIMFQKSLDAGYSHALLRRKIGIDYVIPASLSSSASASSASASATASRVGLVALRTAQRLQAKNLEIFRVDGFLSEQECADIIAVINASELTTSSTYNVTKPMERIVNADRTSKTCYFGGSNPLISDVESRICKTLGINNRCAEQIQGQKYEVGQEFRFHTDYFDPELLKKDASINGQRTWTFMIYLNDVEEGGYTSFPYAFCSCAPKTGTAIVWNNLYSQASTVNANDFGKENPFSSHCGMPIIRGEKYILTKWFKETEINASVPNEISEHHFLPVFHPVGFEKVRMRLECVDAVKEWMSRADESQWTDEVISRDGVESGMVSKHLNMDAAPSKLLHELRDTFHEILTKWIEYKAPLTHTATYGIRKYLRGSHLANHYDKKTTHVISAIIHLDDASDKPWNICIEDHHFRPHRVTMEYGDIVLYESTTCLHGCPEPFEGDSYCNMYVHFKPEKWC